MCMILIVKNKMFMVFERMREMIGKQIRFVVGSSYEPSFCLCISSACNLAVPVRGAKECWTRAKVSENTKRRCRGIPRNENLLRSFMESWHHLIEKMKFHIFYVSLSILSRSSVITQYIACIDQKKSYLENFCESEVRPIDLLYT